MPFKNSVIALLFVFASIQISYAQSGDNYAVPRTEWGHPDLQGVWNFNSETPMQRP